jgi:hypothetical protein
MVMLALIIPLGPGFGGGEPSHPIVLPPGVPPGIWPSPGVPTPPIYYPPTPPGIWPSPGYPSHPIAGPPPGIWPSPGHPAHPIAPGGPPPGYWGGIAPPYPSHPIAPGGPPPGYWGGVAPPLPTHPIAPGGRPSEPPSTEGDWAYSPIYGWVWVPAGSGGKPVPAPPEGGGEVPTPA